MTDGDALAAAVAQTSGAVSAEMQDLLRLVAQDPYVRGPEGLTLVVRGASTAALDALAGGSAPRARPRLTRLAAAAWLLLIMLEMADDDAKVGSAASPSGA